MQISDKVSIVTGAASGIGRATALELVTQGVKGIALVDLSESPLHALADEINQIAGRNVALPLVGDVTDEDFRAQTFDEATRHFGVVQIVVPAAGIFRDRLAVKIDRSSGEADIYPVEAFRQVLEVNLIHPIYWAMEMIARIATDRSSRGLKKWLPEQKVQGTVIFIGSVSSQGNRGQVSYASTKAGLEGAASTLMKEAMFHGVRTGVIHPGFVDTPLLQNMPDGYVEEHILPDTQLGRLIRPEEIADAICFMVRNSAVSGQLWADAGWHPAAA
ncbi:MAG: SDR family NAD(P)-dependent oxidoreductase [Arenicellales bacterium]|nr:SDR family NAD(P)-dependent oxidoreductase [Arenicellales bacterium]